MSDKCPKCGAAHKERLNKGTIGWCDEFACYSVFDKHGDIVYEDTQCLERQLAQQARELEQANDDIRFADGALADTRNKLFEAEKREAELREALGTANFTIEQRKAGEAELRERLVAANRRASAKDAMLARVKKCGGDQTKFLHGESTAFQQGAMWLKHHINSILADVPEVLALFDTNGHGEIKIGPIREPATIIVLGRDERGE